MQGRRRTAGQLFGFYPTAHAWLTLAPLTIKTEAEVKGHDPFMLTSEDSILCSTKTPGVIVLPWKQVLLLAALLW